jgi:hypothetical protein
MKEHIGLRECKSITAFLENQSQRSWRVLLALCILAGAFPYCVARPIPRRLVLSPKLCSALSTAQQKWLTPEWQPYLEYTRICPVRNSKSQAVVFLISVHADVYYKAQTGTSVPLVKLPSPLLFLPSGEVAGSLPYNFPDDPPAELRVTFANWQADFPQRIDLFLTDARAGGNRSLPSMVWDKSQKKYLPKENTPQ